MVFWFINRYKKRRYRGDRFWFLEQGNHRVASKWEKSRNKNAHFIGTSKPGNFCQAYFFTFWDSFFLPWDCCFLKTNYFCRRIQTNNAYGYDTYLHSSISRRPYCGGVGTYSHHYVPELAYWRPKRLHRALHPSERRAASKDEKSRNRIINEAKDIHIYIMRRANHGGSLHL